MHALLIFDVDGTLFETQRVTVPAVQQTFRRYGLPEPVPETICGFFGRPVSEYEAWVMAQCPAGRSGEILEATNRRELELIGETGVLYPGVREMLEVLRGAGHRLAICSNGPDAYVEEFVRAHGLALFFDAVSSRGLRPENKTMLVQALMAQIPAPQTAVIGDRADDVEAAHANGAYAIAARYGFGSGEELRGADAHVYHASEIPEAVEFFLFARTGRGVAGR